MEIKPQTTRTIIGRLATAKDLDPGGSFYSVWTEFNDEPALIELDQKFFSLGLLSNRVGLVIYAPDNFQFWTGVEVPADWQTPVGWQRYTIPAGRVAQFDLPQPQYLPQVPMNYKLNQIYTVANQEKIQMPDSLGHAEAPYFVEKLRFKQDLETVSTQSYQVYLSSEITALEDDLG